MDPYAPVSSRPPPAVPERESERQSFLRRLRLLGATEDEMATTAQSWDDMDETWTAARRSHLVSASDEELRAELRAVREEYAVGVTDETEAERQEQERAYSRALAGVPGRMGASVRDLVEWVDGDPARAHVVFTLESSPEGQRRSSLLNRIEGAAQRWGPLPEYGDEG